MKKFPRPAFIIFVLLCCATYWNAATFVIVTNDLSQVISLGAAIVSGLAAASVLCVTFLERHS